MNCGGKSCPEVPGLAVGCRAEGVQGTLLASPRLDRVEFSEDPAAPPRLQRLFQSAADDSTTYLHLRQTVPGWQEQKGGFAVANYVQASEALSLLSPERV